MSSYKELEIEFNEKVDALQKICQHDETEWMNQHWAPGHYTPYRVKICLICRKQLKKELKTLGRIMD